MTTDVSREEHVGPSHARGSAPSRPPAASKGLAGFGFATEPADDPRRRPLRAAAQLLLIAAFVGAMLAGSLVVPTMGAAAALREANAWWSAVDLPVLLDEPLPQRSTILAADGSVIATFYAENRLPMTAEEIPDVVRNAIIATEDSRFYSHHGVDPVGTLRAVLTQLRGGYGGGSGITQQYVKNLLVTQARTEAERDAATAVTLERKFKEARAAMALEERMSKEEILTAYLNTVYFGDGAYGIGAAAQHFFSKKPTALTLPEAALLAGLIQSPTRLNPLDNPDAALTRRSHVLGRMLNEHYITDAQAEAADAAPLVLKPSTPANGCTTSRFPFYCQWVRETLANNPVFGATEDLRQRALYAGGLTIRTALDPKVQRAADAAARRAIPAKSNYAAALAVVEPGTGKVLALGTNRRWGTGKGQTQILLPVVPAFQQGSTFKPYTAATALQAGIGPEIAFTAGPTYIPENRNYPDGGFHNSGDGPGGYYDMAGALRNSVNTWFVALEDQVGVKAVADTARRLGLTSLPVDGPRAVTEKDASLTLGTYETSPLLVANTYATIAARGLACNPVGIVSITRVGGQSVAVPQADCTQVLSPSVADTLIDMMRGVISEQGTGFRAVLPDARPAAGKTGTTNDSAACWFAGFTRQYATAVWIGDPRGGFEHPLENLQAYDQVWEPVYGGTVPALIWKDVMSVIHQGKPILGFTPPGGAMYVGSPVLVPDVRGMDAADATRLLERAGLSVTVLRDRPVVFGYPPGRVVGTTPSAGQRAPADPRVPIQVHVAADG